MRPCGCGCSWLLRLPFALALICSPARPGGRHHGVVAFSLGGSRHGVHRHGSRQPHDSWTHDPHGLHRRVKNIVRGRRGEAWRGYLKRGNPPRTEDSLSVADALERMPAKVTTVFAAFKQSTTVEDAQEVLTQLNEVYRRAQEDRDEAGFHCAERRLEAKKEVEDARDSLKEAERALTQLQDRMQSIQAALDRSLAEVEALRVQFEDHRNMCNVNQAKQREALTLLNQDLPVAGYVVGNTTATCNKDSTGAGPELYQCTMSDGSYVTTFSQTSYRSIHAMLSSVTERLLSMHLDRVIRRETEIEGVSLLEVHSSTHRNLRSSTRAGATRANVAIHKRGRMVQRQHRRLFRSRSRVRRAKAGRSGASIRNLLQMLSVPEDIPADLCTLVQTASCPGFADNMYTFAGNVQDLIDELKVTASEEDAHCQESLGTYRNQIKDLKQRADEGQVELANAVAEHGELQAQRRERRIQLQDMHQEEKSENEGCDQQLDDADEAMCSARKLRKELERVTGQALSEGFRGDCEVTSWVSTPCNQPCGEQGGQRHVSRKIVKSPAPDLCPVLNMTITCNQRKCPVDAIMGRWQDWSPCSRACGGGTRTRHRQIAQEAQYGGLPAAETMQEQFCNTQPCDQDCLLEEWSDWGVCSKACLKGHRLRHRDVRRQALGEGMCPPDDDPARREVRLCHYKDCEVASPTCASEVDVVLVLDTSGSVGAEGVEASRSFALTLASRTNMGDLGGRYGVVTFGMSNGHVQAELTGVLADFQAGMGSLDNGKNATNTGQALALVGDMLEQNGRATAQQVALVVTDGMPLSSYILSTETKRLQSRGVRVAFLIVGQAVSRRAVRQWVSWPTEENVIEVPSYAKLDEDAATAVLTNLCPTLGSPDTTTTA